MKKKWKVALPLTAALVFALAGTAQADNTITTFADPPSNFSQIGWTANAHGSCSSSCSVIFRYRWNGPSEGVGAWYIIAPTLTPQCGSTECDWTYSENDGTCTTGPLFGNVQYQIGVKDTSQFGTELQWYGPDGTANTVENC